jgi:hypothetical protein
VCGVSYGVEIRSLMRGLILPDDAQ